MLWRDPWSTRLPAVQPWRFAGYVHCGAPYRGIAIGEAGLHDPLRPAKFVNLSRKSLNTPHWTSNGMRAIPPSRTSGACPCAMRSVSPRRWETRFLRRLPVARPQRLFRGGRGTAVDCGLAVSEMAFYTAVPRRFGFHAMIMAPSA